MIGISEKLAIHPNKLILVSGEIKQKEDFDNKLNTLIPDIFGNSLTVISQIRIAFFPTVL